MKTTSLGLNRVESTGTVSAIPSERIKGELISFVEDKDELFFTTSNLTSDKRVQIFIRDNRFPEEAPFHISLSDDLSADVRRALKIGAEEEDIISALLHHNVITNDNNVPFVVRKSTAGALVADLKEKKVSLRKILSEREWEKLL